MNIQFGNFIEKVMDEVVRDNPNNEIITEYSGKKSNKFKLSKASDTMIDNYITNCQIENMSETKLEETYKKLIDGIHNNEFNLDNEFAEFKHDVDILFKDKITNIYYYVEIKYNDDHDTGKFVDINRKVLKTYAYLKRELGKDITLKPILFYFNNKKMKGNIYLPENLVIYRGKKFFEQFANIKYDDIDKYMKDISENKETIEAFNNLYKTIVS